MSKAASIIVTARTILDPILARLGSPFWRPVNSFEFTFPMSELTFRSIRTIASRGHERTAKLSFVKLRIDGWLGRRLSLGSRVSRIIMVRIVVTIGLVGSGWGCRSANRGH